MHAMSSIISGRKDMQPHLILLPKFQHMNQEIQQQIRILLTFENPGVNL